MAAIRWEREELNRLEFDMREAGLLAALRVREVIRRTGNDVVARAQEIVPVDTGTLKNSIGVDIDTDPHHLGFVAGPTAEYGAAVEFGTSEQAPQAYMGPAFDYAVAEAVPLLERIMDQILR